MARADIAYHEMDLASRYGDARKCGSKADLLAWLAVIPHIAVYEAGRKISDGDLLSLDGETQQMLHGDMRVRRETNPTAFAEMKLWGGRLHALVRSILRRHAHG